MNKKILLLSVLVSATLGASHEVSQLWQRRHAPQMSRYEWNIGLPDGRVPELQARLRATEDKLKEYERKDPPCGAPGGLCDRMCTCCVSTTCALGLIACWLGCSLAWIQYDSQVKK